MVTHLPEQWKIDLIDRANYLRGRFLTSYAQCEFLLADLSVKVDSRFIYALKNRVKAAQSIVERDGPFNQYAAEVTALTKDLDAWTDFRHSLAHGFLIFTTDRNNNHEFEFRRYESAPGQTFELHMWRTNAVELERATEAINQFCITFVSVFQRIYLEQGLEKDFRELF